MVKQVACYQGCWDQGKEWTQDATHWPSPAALLPSTGHLVQPFPLCWGSSWWQELNGCEKTDGGGQAQDLRLFLFSRLHLEDDVVPGKSLTNSWARGYSHLAMNLQLATANLFISLGKSVLCSNLLHTLTRGSASGLIFSVLCFPPFPFRQWEFSMGKKYEFLMSTSVCSPSASKKNQVCISFYLWRELWT